MVKITTTFANITLLVFGILIMSDPQIEEINWRTGPYVFETHISEFA